MIYNTIQLKSIIQKILIIYNVIPYLRKFFSKGIFRKKKKRNPFFPSISQIFLKAHPLYSSFFLYEALLYQPIFFPFKYYFLLIFFYFSLSDLLCFSLFKVLCFSLCLAVLLPFSYFLLFFISWMILSLSLYLSLFLCFLFLPSVSPFLPCLSHQCRFSQNRVQPI